jgi:phosphopantothenate---cysteine ligase (CTP)
VENARILHDDRGRLVLQGYPTARGRGKRGVDHLIHVLVTGGGTIAPIDDVRCVTNASSGRFSAAITEECLRRGAEVWHLHTPNALLPFARDAAFDLETPDPRAEFDRLAALKREWDQVAPRLHRVPLETGAVSEYAAGLERLLKEHSIDVCFAAMAVSDFIPEARPGKLDSERESLNVEWKPTPKIIRFVREWSPSVYLVGFKLLSGVPEHELTSRALEAGRSTQADLTVANDWKTVSEGRHVIHLVRPNNNIERLGPRPDLAAQLVERVFKWQSDKIRTARPEPPPDAHVS